MDLSILGGLAAGLGILVLALMLGHVPVEVLLHPEALLIVFAGTITATLAGAGSEAPKRALKTIFTQPSQESRLAPQEIIAQVMDVVGFIRTEGILALQPLIDGVELPFFRKGLMLLMDNRPEKFVRDALSTEMEILHRQGLDDARVFETAGGYAPTMGIIGAVIGLVCVLQGITGNTGPLGQGVAAAFIATLYGVAFANLFLLPSAARLRKRAREEWQIRALLVEAVLGIHAGEHPLLLEERLTAFCGISDTQNNTATPSTSILQPLLATVGLAGSISKGGNDANRPIGLLPVQAVLQDDFLQIPAAAGGKRYQFSDAQ